MVHVVSILALLLNALLLPGSWHVPTASSTRASGHASFAHHETQVGHGKHKLPHEADHHQTCHFCRLVGVAIPLPPMAAIERATEPEAVAWPEESGESVFRARGRTAHRPRAPPMEM